MIGPAFMGDFSAEQRDVIGLPVGTRALVLAAAGTGKTHTLAGRLMRLVDDEGLSAGDDVLVLSFSRAAVAELKRRISGLSGDARYVGTATFDSFASRILASAEPEGSWADLSYEERIRSAIDLLSRSGASDELQIVRHVLVDEIQDLVGARAELVMALLQRIESGFTLFGDPAQAIYGHQARKERIAPVTPDLCQWLPKHFADLVTLQLTRDYRAAALVTRTVASVGMRLREPEPDHGAISHEFRSILLGLPTVGLAAAKRVLTRKTTDTSALLTRTNGEALILSRELYAAGIPHRYQRRGEEKAAPAWLGELTAGFTETRATRATLATRLDQVAAAMSTSPDALYGLLRALAPGRSREVDLRRIADRVRNENLPEELNTVASSPVVVSTIHRAKGLEFDRVLLTGPSDRYADDPCEEDRVLYVALSRAHREIFFIDRPNTAGLALDKATGRWTRRGFEPDRWKVRELEVTGRDTHALHPAGAWLLGAHVTDTQEYLKTMVRPGDPVSLRLLDWNSEDDAPARYAIYHEGQAIGMTSAEFGQTLGLAFRTRRPSGWPQQIDGIHVELVDTVAGPASNGHAYGLGCGLWLRVRVFGLGMLHFSAGGSPGGD